MKNKIDFLGKNVEINHPPTPCHHMANNSAIASVDSSYLAWFPRVLAVSARVLVAQRECFPPDVTVDILTENMSRRHAELIRKDAAGTMTKDESSFLSLFINANMCRAREVEIAVMTAQLGRDLSKDRKAKRKFLQNLHLMVFGHNAPTDQALDLFLEDYGGIVLPGIEQYWNVIRMDFQNPGYNRSDEDDEEYEWSIEQ